MIKTLLFIFLITAFLAGGCMPESNGRSDRNEHQRGKAFTFIKNKPKAFRINVFIENSASMDGYVNQVTAFQQSVYALVADLQASHQVSEVNLYYLNNSPVAIKLHASNKDAGDFLTQLSPAAFKKNSVARGSSDLKTNLELALQKVDAGAASIFISDCIFSPGQKIQAGKYLMSQETGLKASFRFKLDTVPFTTQILKFNGLFNGFYFDQNDDKSWLNYKVRPYYVIVMGPAELLSSLLSLDNLEQYRSRGLADQAIISPPLAHKVSAKIIYKYKLGQFTLQAPANRLIVNEARPSDDGKFRIAVAANLWRLDLKGADLTRSTRYELTPGFKLDSIIQIMDTTEKSTKGMTHIFLFSSVSLKQTQDLTFRLIPKIPEWVIATSTDNDKDLLSTGQLNRTFGLLYLINGIKNAYESVFHQPAVLTLQIQINRDSGSSDDGGGFNWLMVLIPAVLIVVFIFIKNRK